MPMSSRRRKKTPTPATVEVHDNVLRIRFDYDERRVAAVRSIPGRRWHRKERIWTCPLSSLPEVISALGPLGFAIPPDVAARCDAIMAKRAAKTARQAKAALRREAAEKALLKSKAARAFVPAGDQLLTRRIKAAGAFREIVEHANFGATVIGYEVPEETLVRILRALGRPSDPGSRLLALLRYLFRINAEAKQSRSHYSRAVLRYGKKEHLLAEACRLAALQDRFVWGWKEDPCPPANGAGWVLYFAADGRQVSFHTFDRGQGPAFPGNWDGIVNLKCPW